MPAFNYSSTAGEMTLVSDISSSATIIAVSSVAGLPVVPFKLVLDPGQSTEEIVKVTAASGTSLTVTRGWDGTSGQAHSALAKIRHMMTAEDLRLSRQHEDLTSAHGVAGAVVGTTDTQVLTNKDLTGATNSFPTTLASSADLTAHTGATVAHGATGAVVGTTNTQTLTGKTLDGASNTFSNIPQAAVTGVTTMQTDVNNLKSTVNSITLDSGWNNITITAGGWTVPAGVTWQARMIGNRVYLRGNLQNGSFSGGWTQIGTLPAGITSPPIEVSYAIGNNSISNTAVIFHTDGTVWCYAEAGTPAYWTLPGFGWLTD